MYRTLKVRFFLSNFWGAVQNAKSSGRLRSIWLVKGRKYMIVYRRLYSKYVDDYYDYLNQLDTETDFMMFEPKERELKVGKEKIASWLIKMEILYW